MKIGKWILGKKRQVQRETVVSEQTIVSEKDEENREVSEEAPTDTEEPLFDREHQRPVIRSSICTGEQVAGFKDLRTGRFTEIMLVRNNEDMEEFTRKYGISREEIRREW